MPNPTQTIAVVDDSKLILKLLAETLETVYTVRTYASGLALLEDWTKSSSALPDLVLLDVNMPGISGYEVLKQLKKTPAWAHIPVLLLTAQDDKASEVQGLNLGAEDFISKNFVPASILARIKVHMELLQHRNYLEFLVEEKTRALAQMQDVILLNLLQLLEMRNHETAGHTRRTTIYVRILLRELLLRDLFPGQLNESVATSIARAAPLHDVGKIGIPDSILLKQSALTAEEFQLMQQHTVLGGTAIQNALEQSEEKEFLTIVRDIALFHHEKWNGSGYPHQLAGEQIPLPARIMAVADVYDALVSSRAYKNNYSHTEAMQLIAEGSGQHFDPKLIEVLLSVSELFHAVSSQG